MRAPFAIGILAATAVVATVEAWQTSPFLAVAVACLSFVACAAIANDMAAAKSWRNASKAQNTGFTSKHGDPTPTLATHTAEPGGQSAPQDGPADSKAPAESPSPVFTPANSLRTALPAAPIEATPKTDATPDAESAFSFEAFRRSVLFSEDPIQTLRAFVDDVRARESTSADAHSNTGGSVSGSAEKNDVRPRRTQPPTDVELFVARRLEEAGLFTTDDEDELPAMRIVWPYHSKIFYLRCSQADQTYGTHLRIIRIEAALNALRFAYAHYDALAAVSMEDLYRFSQRMTTTVSAQASNVDTADWSYLAMPWQGPIGPSQQGEWAVRYGISDAIESVQVPYRLEASFRTNVAAGDVALEFAFTPAHAFPKSAYVDGLGIVPTTREMRERESSNYAARLGLLLANKAFHTSKRIRRVWIAAVEETPTRRDCLYSVCLERKVFSHVPLEAIPSPLDTLRSLGTTMAEDNGILRPTTQIFYLEDERFCPPMRHDLWELSERVLPASAALSLGTSRVSGLSIHEELPRMLAAESILRRLPSPTDPTATQASVRAVLETARSTSDMAVWGAAERVAGKLVDGSLEPGDTQALRDEMIHGDALSKAIDKAHELLFQADMPTAINVLQGAVSPIDREGLYDDTPAIVYRCFDSFAERVLYNRRNARDHRSLVLVPDAYLMAHLMLSSLLIALPEDQGGNVERALWHAQRALRVAPLNPSAHLAMVAYLEHTEKNEEACEQLRELLDVAYSPHSIGLAYYRLANLQAKMGNEAACKACYQRCVSLVPALLPIVHVECQLLAVEGFTFDDEMDEARIDSLLEEHGIPTSPSTLTSFILYDGATASIDAEVFPVARDLMRVIESFEGDDVLRGVTNSLELEPDA